MLFKIGWILIENEVVFVWGMVKKGLIDRYSVIVKKIVYVLEIGLVKFLILVVFEYVIVVILSRGKVMFVK